MSRVIVDPEECAHYLLLSGIRRTGKRCDGFLQEALLKASEVWRDMYGQKFDESFREEIAKLESYLNSLSQYTEYLHRKAEAADQYFNVIIDSPARTRHNLLECIKYVGAG